MPTPISSWGAIAIAIVLGAIAGGVALARQRRAGARWVLIGVWALVIGGGAAIYWDRATRTSVFGEAIDTQRIETLDATGSSTPYIKAKQRWQSATPEQRMQWRIESFAIAAGLCFAGGAGVLLVAPRALGWKCRRSSALL